MLLLLIKGKNENRPRTCPNLLCAAGALERLPSLAIRLCWGQRYWRTDSFSRNEYPDNPFWRNRYRVAQSCSYPELSSPAWSWYAQPYWHFRPFRRAWLLGRGRAGACVHHYRPGFQRRHFGRWLWYRGAGRFALCSFCACWFGDRYHRCG